MGDADFDLITDFDPIRDCPTCHGLGRVRGPTPPMPDPLPDVADLPNLDAKCQALREWLAKWQPIGDRTVECPACHGSGKAPAGRD